MAPLWHRLNADVTADASCKSSTGLTAISGTDRPPCVHPVLAKLAIRANDSLDDKGRQKLLDLAPRLMGTASDDKMLSVKLAVFCARKVLHLFEAKVPKRLSSASVD